MKSRIIGSILVLLSVVALYVITGGDNSATPTAPISIPSANDNALKTFSIN